MLTVSREEGLITLYYEEKIYFWNCTNHEGWLNSNTVRNIWNMSIYLPMGRTNVRVICRLFYFGFHQPNNGQCIYFVRNYCIYHSLIINLTYLIYWLMQQCYQFPKVRRHIMALHSGRSAFRTRFLPPLNMAPVVSTTASTQLWHSHSLILSISAFFSCSTVLFLL